MKIPKEEEPSMILKNDDIEMNFETDFDLPLKEEELKAEDLKPQKNEVKQQKPKYTLLKNLANDQ